MYGGAPKSLGDPAEVARRLDAWEARPDFAPIRDYIADLSTARRRIPKLDPGDAGPDARVLLVLEAPGPRSDAARGSGFISVDNADQTASNVWRARHDAGLVEGVAHWNIVPWYQGAATVKPSPVDLAEGAIQLRRLIDLMPQLSAVVLCGEYAKRGYRAYVAGLFDGNGPDIVETWHPSPSSLNFGTKRQEFTGALARVRRLLGDMDITYPDHAV